MCLDFECLSEKLILNFDFEKTTNQLFFMELTIVYKS